MCHNTSHAEDAPAYAPGSAASDAAQYGAMSSQDYDDMSNVAYEGSETYVVFVRRV